MRGEVIDDPKTIATAIRIGNPASWEGATDAAASSGGMIGSVRDKEILEAYRSLAEEGIFVELASAASLAGLRQLHELGTLPSGATVCLRADRPRPEGPRLGDRRSASAQAGSGPGRADPRRTRPFPVTALSCSP